MPLFKKKATVQELVQYTRGTSRNGSRYLHMHQDGSAWPYVQIRQDGTAYVWNELHRSEINLDDGDYVNVTTPGDFYPIKAAIVAESYEPME